MTVKQFDKRNVDALSADIEKAVQSVAKKYNVAIRQGSGSYNQNEFKLRLECNVLGATGEKLVDTRGLEMYGSLYGGVSKADLGKIITVQGTQYKFSGLTISRPKYPFDMTRVSDGKQFKFPTSYSEQIKKSTQF